MLACFLLFHSTFEHLSPSAVAAKSPLCLSNHVDILLLKCLSCHTDGGTKKSGAFLEDMDRFWLKEGGDPEKCTLFLAGSFSSSIRHIEQKSQHQECSQG